MAEIIINVYQGKKTIQLTPKFNSEIKELDTLLSSIIAYIFLFTERLAKHANTHEIKYNEPFDIQVFQGTDLIFDTTNSYFDSERVNFKFEQNDKSKLNFIQHLYPLVLQHISAPYDEIEFDSFIKEGKVKRVATNVYERNPAARKKCLEVNGYNCKVCNMNFEDYYGSIGLKYIHVHHITPISSIKKEYHLNPTKDLIPVCPNCHAMLHKQTPPFSIEELRKKIKTTPQQGV